MGKADWVIPELWPNSTVYIIGGGPSVLNTNLPLIHSKRVIGVNCAFSLGAWVDLCYFGDGRWYHWNHKELRSFGGLKVTCFAGANVEQWPGVMQVRRGKPEGIDTRKRHLSWNKNSGGSAINLAYHLGAKRIVLIGYDMKVDENENHNWHTKYVGKHTPPIKIYENRFLACYKTIKRDADKLGIEILNTNPDSALLEFPFVKLEDTL